MAAPLLQAQIDIDAPVTKVWALVSDLSRMPQWSPQCRLMKTLGGRCARAAGRSTSTAASYLFWPTTSRITEFIPEKKLAFRVNANRTVWSYELEPTATGTRLTETPPRRERRHGGLQHVGQRVDRRRAQLRARTRRGHERSRWRGSRPPPKASRSRLGEVEHAVVVGIVERRTGAGAAAAYPSVRRSRTRRRPPGRRRTTRWRTRRTSIPATLTSGR